MLELDIITPRALLILLHGDVSFLLGKPRPQNRSNLTLGSGRFPNLVKVAGEQRREVVTQPLPRGELIPSPTGRRLG